MAEIFRYCLRVQLLELDNLGCLSVFIRVLHRKRAHRGHVCVGVCVCVCVCKQNCTDGGRRRQTDMEGQMDVFLLTGWCLVGLGAWTPREVLGWQV